MEYAADEDGKIRAVRAKLVVGLGAYLQLVTAGTPILGGWVYGGPYDIEAYSLEVVGAFTSATPTDAYRGAGPAGGDLPDRAHDRRARAQARHGPGRAPAQELHHGVPVHAGLRAPDRLRRLRRRARPRAGDGRLRRAPGRAGRAPRARRHEGARDRLLHLHGDVRPGAVAHPRGDPLRGRRLGRGHDPLPADRLGAGLHRHLAARPGPRDDVLADRRRPARHPARPDRGRPRRHDHDAARPRHVREPEPRGRRDRALQRGREGDRQGPRGRRAQARGRARTTSSSRTAPSPSPAPTSR